MKRLTFVALSFLLFSLLTTSTAHAIVIGIRLAFIPQDPVAPASTLTGSLQLYKPGNIEGTFLAVGKPQAVTALPLGGVATVEVSQPADPITPTLYLSFAGTLSIPSSSGITSVPVFATPQDPVVPQTPPATAPLVFVGVLTQGTQVSLPVYAFVTPTARIGGTDVTAVPNQCHPSQLIDNFSIGKYRVNLRSGSDLAVQTGTKILGGRRVTQFSLCDLTHPGDCEAANQFNQLATLDIRPDGNPLLLLDAGARVFYRLVVYYGYDLANEQFVSAPLNADLSCFSKFRVTFNTSDLTVNFNMHVTAGNNPVVATAGVNIPPGPATGLPFVVELPFSSFVPNAGPLPDFHDIDVINLILQSGSNIGANDFAITRVEALP